MTVIAVNRTEIDRMSVLQDLAASRIKVAEAATLMSLGRRQVSRLAMAYAQRGPGCLGLLEARPAKQSLLPCGFTLCGTKDDPEGLMLTYIKNRLARHVS